MPPSPATRLAVAPQQQGPTLIHNPPTACPSLPACLPACVSQGLALFQGGVLMVSHDQHLIESTVDELWAVENGTGEGVCSLGIWLAVLVAPIGAC